MLIMIIRSRKHRSHRPKESRSCQSWWRLATGKGGQTSLIMLCVG